MSIFTEAKFLYGAPYTQLSGLIDNLDELLDDEDLTSASPHYDAPRTRWFVGVPLRESFEGIDQMFNAAEAAKKKFHKIVGDDVAAIFRVVPNVF
jgi:hypothetical protein